MIETKGKKISEWKRSNQHRKNCAIDKIGAIHTIERDELLSPRRLHLLYRLHSTCFLPMFPLFPFLSSTPSSSFPSLFSSPLHLPPRFPPPLPKFFFPFSFLFSAYKPLSFTPLYIFLQGEILIDLGRRNGEGQAGWAAPDGTERVGETGRDGTSR